MADGDGGRAGASTSAGRNDCGVLWKTGAGSLGGRWRKRWCNLVVESDTLRPTLLYFKGGADERDAGQLRGAISLHKCAGADDIAVSGTEAGLHRVAGSVFTIRAGARVYRLCSAAAEDSARWVALLRDAVRAYREACSGAAAAGAPEVGASTATDASGLGGGEEMERSDGLTVARLDSLERKLSTLMLERQGVAGDAKDEAALGGAGQPPACGREHLSSFDEASQTEAVLQLLRERDEARQEGARALRENADLRTRCELLKACVMDAEDSRDELAEYCHGLEQQMLAKQPHANT